MKRLLLATVLLCICGCESSEDRYQSALEHYETAEKQYKNLRAIADSTPGHDVELSARAKRLRRARTALQKAEAAID